MRGPVGRLRNRAVGWIGRNVLFAEAQRRYDDARAELGLPAARRPVLEESVSPYLHLHGAVPSFDYPREQLPSHMHWVGALRPDTPTDWPRPELVDRGHHVDEARGAGLPGQHPARPHRAGRADASAPWPTPTSSSWSPPARPTRSTSSARTVDPLPANLRVAKFVPYDQLLPHVSCFVTNGGYTGVTLALHHGVPLVQAGTTEEKAEIGARIAWTGVGVRLGTTRPSSDRRCGRWSTWCSPRSRYAAAAGRVRAEMAEHDAGREGADLLERLAATTLELLR